MVENYGIVNMVDHLPVMINYNHIFAHLIQLVRLHKQRVVGVHNNQKGSAGDVILCHARVDEEVVIPVLTHL